jgi:hypothetical protein
MSNVGIVVRIKEDFSTQCIVPSKQNVFPRRTSQQIEFLIILCIVLTQFYFIHIY